MSSKVHFIRASMDEGEAAISQKARALFRAGAFADCFKTNDFTAVKVHVGEQTNNTYIKAPCLKGLVEELLSLKTKPFITDTSTLYTGRRHNAIDHTVLATERGFSVEGLGVPFIAPDGLFGTAETAVPIEGELDKEVMIAADIVRCQSILSIAHFTGHCAACVGATIKTLGMGCSSRKGKMRQHASLKPHVKKGKCTRCGECRQHCPADAITLDDVQAHIDQDKCIGCAECVAVCRFDAVVYDWQQENEILQKSVAEHALGALRGKQGRATFYNFVMSVTKDCDCFAQANMPKIVEDIGILASTDPVAVDKASIDLVEGRGGRGVPKLIGNARLDWRYQIEHAVRIGLGSAEYELVEVK
ncbi:DUF362 domain-containing protein [Anaerobaca lacustris]|uniref:DUF362 domain-containing protein n=1 Tax=Anaerobaca lacustris TaxID=3044600 RepID=A0AAW6TWY0_9BACT|nr:DUF362 domain-containing protein [Sedimentisphaerales bacterium M17dextr]